MTGEHDRFADDVAAYALGALNELEATAFERHLMRCGSCARELQQLRVPVDALAGAVPQHRPPPELKRAVLDAVRREAVVQPLEGSSLSWRRMFEPVLRRRPSLAVAGVFAAAALALGAYGLGSSLSGDEQKVIAASVDSAQLADARAQLTAREDVGVLRATGLPRLGGGDVYVVWLDRGEGPVYGSSFNVQPDGTGEAGIPDLDGVERVMVTREPSTAVTQPSSSPFLTVDLS